MTGKGSAPRPLSVSDEEFGKRFDAIDWSDARVPERKLRPVLASEVIGDPVPEHELATWLTSAPTP